MITYQLEFLQHMENNVVRLGPLLDEIKPLLQDHWKEVGLAGEHKVDLDPNYEAYCVLEQMGRLLIMTARNEDKALIGYLVVIAERHPHHKEEWVARGDLLYIRPENRKGRVGIKLIQETEKVLKEQGVTLFQLSSTNSRNISSLLAHQNFKEEETLYIKYLKEEQ